MYIATDADNNMLCFVKKNFSDVQKKGLRDTEEEYGGCLLFYITLLVERN